MPVQVNCKEIHLACQLLVGVLFPVQLGRRGEAIHHDRGWFGGIIWMWHLVGSSYTTQMGDADDFGIRHRVNCTRGGWNLNETLNMVITQTPRAKVKAMISSSPCFVYPKDLPMFTQSSHYAQFRRNPSCGSCCRCGELLAEWHCHDGSGRDDEP